MELNKEIKIRENKITKVIIKRNDFHKKFFTSDRFEKDFELISGGYNSLLGEILSIYIPNLDRFDKAHDIILSDIYNEINILDEKIKKLMDVVRIKNGYTIGDVKKIFNL